MYITIYMSALMCVYIFLHTLLWVWQSCLEKKISLESLERHCLLEIMQKDRGKHDVLTHWDLSQVKLSEQRCTQEWKRTLEFVCAFLHFWVSCPNLPFEDTRETSNIPRVQLVLERVGSWLFIYTWSQCWGTGCRYLPKRYENIFKLDLTAYCFIRVIYIYIYIYVRTLQRSSTLLRHWIVTLNM